MSHVSSSWLLFRSKPVLRECQPLFYIT